MLPSFVTRYNLVAQFVGLRHQHQECARTNTHTTNQKEAQLWASLKFLRAGGQLNMRNGPQLRFDGYALGFEERRQREALAERFDIFVNVEARPIGRDLK